MATEPNATDSEGAAMKYVWVLLLASVASAQETFSLSSQDTPCVIVSKSVDGGVSISYCDIDSRPDVRELPVVTRPWDFLPLVEPLGPVQLYIIYPPSCEVDPFFYGGYCYKIKVEPYVSEAKQ